MGTSPPPFNDAAILELRLLKMRNTTDAMAQRTAAYVEQALFPSLLRAGAGPLGAFTYVIGPDSPSLLLVAQFPGLNSWESASKQVESDPDCIEASQAWLRGGLGYLSMTTTLLRGFETMPGMEVPPRGNSPRVFEVRVYQSNSPTSLRRKIRMFNEGEIALFRKLGIEPVFFGETIAGANMPNLTYMVAFESLAARERGWSNFVSHPEWEKMKSQPGVSDAEIVSNSSNCLLRPLPFSQIY